MIVHNESNLIMEYIEEEEFSKKLIESLLASEDRNCYKFGLRIFHVMLRKSLQFEKSSMQISSPFIENPEKAPEKDVLLADYNFVSFAAEEYHLIELTEPSNIYQKHLLKISQNVAKAFSSRLEDFLRILKTSNKLPVRTTVGTILEPLGFVRLEIVHSFIGLVASSEPIFMKKFYQLRVIITLTVSICRKIVLISLFNIFFCFSAGLILKEKIKFF